MFGYVGAKKCSGLALDQQLSITTVALYITIFQIHQLI